MTTKWDRDFLSLARFWGERKSKDPSTKVGAVVVLGRHILSLGYNGFPTGVDDDLARYVDRETKYKYIVHAEENAILNCPYRPVGATLYVWPLLTCHQCAKTVIQSGIVNVVYPIEDTRISRWEDSHEVAMQMFKEAGVAVVGI